MRFLALSLLAMSVSAPALAQTADDRTKVLAVIAEWYERVSHPEARQPWALMAPGGIDAGPGHAEIPYIPREQRSAAA